MNVSKKYVEICHLVSLFMLALLISSCGFTAKQHEQIGMFATTTNVAVNTTVDFMISIRSQVIEIRKERIALGDMKVKSNVNLESTLKAHKIAQRVGTLRRLKTYADSLHAALGISGWYLEGRKQEVVKGLVAKHSPVVANVAEQIEQDLSLIGNSPCWPQFRGGAEPGTTPVNAKTQSGILDIFCTQADALREHALNILHCPQVYTQGQDPKHCRMITSTLRNRALTNYLAMNHAMDNAATFSSKGTYSIQKLIAANDKMETVIDDTPIVSDEIEAFDAATAELTTMVEVLAGK
ncbi:MAG: hypothetical protein GKS05_09590 [Nitrospirales bacterium]|nr:hypothetical protein [Nitrospirales bacterium]